MSSFEKVPDYTANFGALLGLKKTLTLNSNWDSLKLQRILAIPGPVRLLIVRALNQLNMFSIGLLL